MISSLLLFVRVFPLMGAQFVRLRLLLDSKTKPVAGMDHETVIAELVDEMDRSGGFPHVFINMEILSTLATAKSGLPSRSKSSTTT